MASDDLLELAKSDVDFYAILGEGVHSNSDEKERARAYRRTALRLHPDKNQNDPKAAEKFHELQIAFDLLSNSGAKEAYDNARLAREAKRRQREAFEGKRRTMIDELERREGSAKRKREEDDAEAALEREIKRLAEDGRRRRKEREERLRKEMQQEQDLVATEAVKEERPNTAASVSDTQRTVKVRWLKEGLGESMDKDRISALCALFGKIELAMPLKDKKVRSEESKKKHIYGNCAIVFASITGAHNTVEHIKEQRGEEWDLIESAQWFEGKEPDILLPSQKATPSSPLPSSAPETLTPRKPPRAFHLPDLGSNPSTPLSRSERGSDGLRKVPSFASFKAAAAGSPSLEEITLIRLKNAEKRRLEDKIRREEAEQQEV